MSGTPPDHDAHVDRPAVRPRERHHRNALKLRKELLVMRARVERLELLHAAHDLRSRAARFGWLKWLAAAWSPVARDAGGLGMLLRRHPWVGSLASVLIAARGGSGTLRRAGSLLKWGLTGYAAYQGWRVAQATKRERPRPQSADGDAAPVNAGSSR